MGEECRQRFMDNVISNDWKNGISFSVCYLSKPSLVLIPVNKSSDVIGKIVNRKMKTCSEECREYPNSLKQGFIMFEARKRSMFKRYRMLFENSPDICLFIDLQGNILEGNKAALKAYGYTREELNQMRVHDLRAAETKDLITRQMHEAYDNGITFETDHVRKNGEHFPVEVRSFRFKTILLSFVQDISWRRQAERDALKTETIKVIGKIAAGLAHEIRNAITGVHGFLQLAEERVISLERLMENCSFMLDELNYADYVISELSLADYNRSLNLEIKNLNQIILEMFPALQALARSQGRSLDTQLEELPEILLDEYEIQKLIRNLVNNALDSLDKGGRALIKTRREANKISLSIRDNGSGIKQDIINQLGTPFLTTKDSGIGLGLVICHSIVIRHKAALTIESSSSGTNVRIIFNLPQS